MDTTCDQRKWMMFKGINNEKNAIKTDLLYDIYISFPHTLNLNLDEETACYTIWNKQVIQRGFEINKSFSS